MFSRSKPVLVRDQIQTLVHATFGAHAAIDSMHELTDGYFNAAYAITLQDGLRCVLKAAPPPSVQVLRYERQIMAAEVTTLQLVKQRTNVPVPTVYGFDATGRLLDSPYFFMEFVPGVPYHRLRPDLPAPVQWTIDATLGDYLRHIHAITGTAFGYGAPDAPRSDTWADAFLHMLDAVLADGAAMDVALPRPYDTLRRQMRQGAAALAEVTTPCLVHWDLWDGNVFIDPQTAQIAGIIDFERALWGDPLMEVQFRTAADDGACIQGYGRPMLDTAARQERRVLYNLYLYLIMIIECSYRHYPTADQERWARAQLAEELERLDAMGRG